MLKHSTTEILQLGPTDVGLYEAMMTMFGEAFEDLDSYCGKRPSHTYIEALLASHTFIAIAALDQGTVVGGLAAYELQKFEQERSEIYLYDLAVAAPYRRRGIATTLIRKVCQIGFARNAYVVFVQADYDDPPAIALYESLGIREQVLHFDIAVSEAEEGP